MNQIPEMLKGRVWTIYGAVALALFIALILAMSSGSGHGVSAQKVEALNKCTLLQVGTLDYYEEYSEMPGARDNRTLIQALTGGNLRKIEFISLGPRQLNANGEMIDPWGTPYGISIGSPSEIHVRSAGPDKVFGTQDDLPTP